MIFCHERFKGEFDIYKSLPLVFNYIASNRRYGHTYYGINDMIPLYYLSDDEFYIQWENMFLGKFEKDYRNYYVYVPIPFYELPELLRPAPELLQPAPEPEEHSRYNNLIPSASNNTITISLNTLKCPITHEMMSEPVMMVDGYSYEKRAIQHWLTQSNRSPMTNLPLHDTRLIPNLKLLEIINEINEI
jgi:hypothetical protein